MSLRWFFLLLLIISFGALGAQKASLRGEVRIGGEPAAFATVSVWQAGQLISGTFTEVSGQFSFSHLPTGSILIRATYLGGDTTQTTIELVEGSNELSSPLILKESSTDLSSVTVRGKQVYETNREGESVLNLDDELRSYAQSGSQLLLLAPGISSDGTESILLDGRSNFAVLIDGRRKFANREDALRFLSQLPPDRIAAIRVNSWDITSLGQEENAGVIDVRLVKDQTQGVNGSVRGTLTQGDNPRTNGAVSLNFRQKGWNAFGGGGVNYAERRRDVGDQLFSPATSRMIRLDQDRTELWFDRTLNYNGGIDYSFANDDIVGLTFSGLHRLGDQDAITNNLYFRGMESEADGYVDQENVKSLGGQFFANLNLAHEGQQKQFRNSLDISYSQSSSDREQMHTFMEVGFPEEEAPDNLNVNRGVVAKIISARYEQRLSFGGKWYWKTGILALRTEIDNQNQNSLGEENPFKLPVTPYRYEEGQAACYNTLWLKGEKNLWSVGLRTEWTDGEVFDNNKVAGQNDVVNWLPALSLWRTVDKRRQLGVRLSTYANRPEYLQILPYSAFESLSEISTGNAEVQPFQSYVTSFRYVLDNKYQLQIRYDFSDNYVPQNFYRPADSNAFTLTERTYANVGDLHGVQIRLVAPVGITPWWTSRNTVNAFINRSISADYPDLDYQWSTISLYSYNNIRLPKDFRLGLGIYFSSQGRTNQNLFYPRQVIDLSVQKNWGDWSLRLTADDLLNRANYEGIRRYGNIRHEFAQRYDTQRFGFSLSFRFGRRQIKEQRWRDRSSSSAEGRLKTERDE